MSAAFHPAAGRDDRPRGLDLAAKVSWVELATENYLIHLAQLGKREVSGQQLECNVRVAHLVA